MQPLFLIPLATSTGILIYLPEPIARQSAGRTLDLGTVCPALPDPPAAGEGGKPLTDPAPIKHWAAVFHVHPQTMASYLRTGQVRGRPVGRLWQIEVRDLPTKDDDSKRR